MKKILFLILATLPLSIALSAWKPFSNIGPLSELGTSRECDARNPGGVDVNRSQTIVVGDVSFEMVFVEGGTFTMGATSEHGGEPSPTIRCDAAVTPPQIRPFFAPRANKERTRSEGRANNERATDEHIWAGVGRTSEQSGTK